MMAELPPPLDELRSLVAIPSVSADPARHPDVVAALEWVGSRIRCVGGSAELVPTVGLPLVVGRVPASTRTPGQRVPTVLIYGHVDVQPEGDPAAWDSDPFELTERDGWLFARGVADDKGLFYPLIRAVQELALEGRLPVDVVIVGDGEEETSGVGAVDYLRRHAPDADVAIVYDALMQGPGRPVFIVGVRGLVYFRLSVRTGTHDVHSGFFGGVALNAVHVLLDALRGVLGPHPDLAVGAQPVPDSLLRSWAATEDTAALLADAGGRPISHAVIEDPYRYTFAGPSLDVHGIAAADPDLENTIVPCSAVASLSIRLAPGQDLDTVSAVLDRLLRERVPAGADLHIDRLTAQPPALTTLDHPAIELAAAVFERTVGNRPLLVPMGATIPIMAPLAERGIPTVLTGFALPASSIHGANECLPLHHLPLAITTSRNLLLSFATL
jgi:acetylornithine deacetylase/succinyl-diaminopimelate desuccinylase-like protein